jgi:hypothetical protein
MEFRGVVNIDAKGEVVCFCSHSEVLQGKCLCRNRDDCPEAIISVEVMPGTRPSEQGISKIVKAKKNVAQDVVKIKEGLSRLEQAVRKTKFRL